jgi:Uma2 family endonuclease
MMIERIDERHMSTM